MDIFVVLHISAESSFLPFVSDSAHNRFWMFRVQQKVVFILYCVISLFFYSLYTKKAVKCADPRDRKVKRLLRKLLQRQRTKAHRTMWLLPHDNLPVMSEVSHKVHYRHSSNPAVHTCHSLRLTVSVFNIQK